MNNRLKHELDKPPRPIVKINRQMKPNITKIIHVTKDTEAPIVLEPDTDYIIIGERNQSNMFTNKNNPVNIGVEVTNVKIEAR